MVEEDRRCPVEAHCSGAYGPLVLGAGRASQELAGAIAGRLGLGLLERDIFQFPNSNTYVRLRASVRGADVFWVQSTSAPTNDNLMELLIAIDTLHRDSAARITAVIPHYGYGRSDKKDKPRVPVTARLVADMITVAGADRVLTMDLHAGQIQGFFTIPVDEISARPLLVDHVGARADDGLVVVAPDTGVVRSARIFAEAVGAPLAVIEKRRLGTEGKARALRLIGDVAGLDAILYDDEIDTGRTMASAARLLRRHGARSVSAMATHAVFSRPSSSILRRAGLAEIAVTNTIAIPPGRQPERLTVLDAAPLLADVIRRVHLGESVGALFER